MVFLYSLPKVSVFRPVYYLRNSKVLLAIVELVF